MKRPAIARWPDGWWWGGSSAKDQPFGPMRRANVAPDDRNCSMVAPHNILVLAFPNSQLLDVTGPLQTVAAAS